MHEGAEGYHPREVSIVDFASGKVVAHYQAPREFELMDVVPFADHAIITRGRSDALAGGYYIDLVRIEYHSPASHQIVLPDGFLWTLSPVIVDSTLVSVIAAEDGRWCLVRLAGTSREELTCMADSQPYSLLAARGGVTVAVSHGALHDDPDFQIQYFPLAGGPSRIIFEKTAEPVFATVTDDWVVWHHWPQLSGAQEVGMELWAKGGQTQSQLLADVEYFGFLLCGNYLYWNIDSGPWLDHYDLGHSVLVRYEIGAHGVERVYEAESSGTYVSPPRCFANQVTFIVFEHSPYDGESRSRVYLAQS